MPAPTARVAWPEVVAHLEDEERSTLASLIRDSGFSADSFAARIEPRQVAADGLTAVEDALESRRGSRIEARRVRIQAVRRRLERELWP